jgi:hypothetical protein
VLAVVSAMLLPVLEVQAVSDEYAYADRIFGDAARWLRFSSFVRILRCPRTCPIAQTQLFCADQVIVLRELGQNVRSTHPAGPIRP